MPADNSMPSLREGLRSAESGERAVMEAGLHQ